MMKPTVRDWIHRLNLERPNIELLNLERLNMERLNLGRPKIERLNLERPNLERQCMELRMTDHRIWMNRHLKPIHSLQIFEVGPFQVQIRGSVDFSCWVFIVFSRSKFIISKLSRILNWVFFRGSAVRCWVVIGSVVRGSVGAWYYWMYLC